MKSINSKADAGGSGQSEGRAGTIRLARRLTILNQGGIYLRTGALLVKTMYQHGPHTEVLITCDDRTINGKSIMDLITIEPRQGREFILEARGPEAREVIEAVTELMNAGLQSGEPCLPIPPSHSEWLDLPEQSS